MKKVRPMGWRRLELCFTHVFFRIGDYTILLKWGRTWSRWRGVQISRFQGWDLPRAVVFELPEVPSQPQWRYGEGRLLPDEQDPASRQGGA